MAGDGLRTVHTKARFQFKVLKPRGPGPRGFFIYPSEKVLRHNALDFSEYHEISLHVG